MIKIFIYLISFLIVFNFPLPFVYNSALLGVLLSLPFYGTKKNIDGLIKIIRSKQFKAIAYSYIFISIYAAVWTISHNANDFSIIKGYLLVLFLIVSFILIYPLVINYTGDNWNTQAHKIINLLLILFLVQSVIQILAFVFPSFAEIIRSFHKIEFITDDRNRFIKFRALALTGNPFFSLASGYCLIFVFFFYLLSIKKITFSLIKFILLLIGSFFSGRTAFIGVLIGGLLYLFNSDKSVFRQSINLLKLIFILIIFLIFLYDFLPSGIKNIVDSTFLPWLFEFYYSYKNEGTLTTTSSNHLIDRMYYLPTLETFFLGDGRYSNADGSYYGYTDAGYMRNILFYGILGFLIILFLQFKAAFTLFKFRNTPKFFFIITIFTMLILHIKGDVLMHSPMASLLFSAIILTSFSENQKLL